MGLVGVFFLLKSDIFISIMRGYSLNLALQPIVDLLTGQIKHYEALMRIQGHAVYGNSHVSMLSAAETAGWIDQVDIGVMGQAINVLRNCDIDLAVNLSPRTLEVAAEGLLKMLRRGRDVSHRLIIEITESAQIRDLPALCEFVGEARKLGCEIAVDDYGSSTGFFTDEIVAAINPDFLKLDRNVLESESERTSLLARAFLLADAAGAEVIAEFIDTEEKQRFISSLGIRYAQGKLYGLATPWQDSQARRSARIA